MVVEARVIKEEKTINPVMVNDGMITDIVAQKLAVAARESLSSYCYSECKAYCCRRGYLLLSEEEVGLMLNIHKEDLNVMPLRDETDKKRYIFNLGSKGLGCPNLSEYKCIIHKNPKRPKACKEFPLFFWGDKTIVVTDECPAVKENKLYPYLSQFKTMGYKVVYVDKNYKN
ncbi:MAG: YkgJ family cysteine cluster protein [Candidatus Woesearchaeota archaeon]